ncbi:hypothetical protein GQ42DRAFT_119455 [Ramicandelaber brevisporus]|nr:hypothetical protein GQ42DRAFT_119455 [Ramicandelaber brevisporus]
MQAQQLFMAEQEIDMIADLHERVSDSCYKKCIPDTYYEGSLTKGESVCLDRCVAKFFETSIKIGKHMQQLAGNASPQ